MAAAAPTRFRMAGLAGLAGQPHGQGLFKVRSKAAHAAAGASWMELECGMSRCIVTCCRGHPAGSVALDLPTCGAHDAVT